MAAPLDPADEVSSAFPGLLDVTIPVEVVLGTGRLTVRECLGLVRSRVIQLEQSAGADLKVTANGIALARAEVVIVEDSTAVRVTEIDGSGLESA